MVVELVDEVCALATTAVTNRAHIIVSNDFIDPFWLMLNLELDAQFAGPFKIQQSNGFTATKRWQLLLLRPGRSRR